MDIRIHDDAAAVARAGTAFVIDAARRAIAERGRFLFAVSGGKTPWVMMAELARADVDWTKWHLFQVDERIAPAGDPDRNLTHLQESLLAHVALPAENVHAMPVEEPDSTAATIRYGEDLERLAGRPPVLDLIHLGLGPDGHTASLVPDDAVLGVRNRDVAITASAYQGRHRMTLTYPVLDRAREILWLIDGAAKADMLPRVRKGDTAIPAGRVRNPNAVAIVDREAAAKL
ncbi:6-phosphogluconolactonase [Candidatus Binatia bacterium]|jgi:6-phosphogluconolactonase|nr:6-phosphogluconolactonase [Candidatus Binatia bacterium]